MGVDPPRIKYVGKLWAIRTEQPAFYDDAHLRIQATNYKGYKETAS